MNHRKWKDLEWNRMYIRSMVSEHDALYEDWQQSSLEAERLAKVNGDLCDKIAELEQPIRVPFSDEAIEKMAEAAADTWHREEEWYQGYDNTGKQQWRDLIRAALAAGGIEPCAVPEYAPEDVAFSAERASDEELAEIFDAGYEDGALPLIVGIRAVRARVESPLLAEIQRLQSQWNMAARAESDRTAERDTLKARVAELEAEARANIEWQEVMALDLNNKKDELEAVKADRDELRGVRERLMLIVEQQAQELQDDPQFRACRKELSELKIELAALRQPVESRPVKVRWDVTADDAWLVFRDDTSTFCPDSMRVTMDYLAAHAVIDVPKGVGQTPAAPHEPTDAEVEALARVLREGVTCPVCSGHTNDDDRGCCCERTLARAAFAHIGRVPVGFELDVTWDEVRRNYEVLAERETEVHEDHADQIDWLRSRIRPVYECKECAEMKEHVKAERKQNLHLAGRISAARAALEGE